MSTKSSIASVMAWNWVVQSIARFKQVDPSTLTGVVKKAPGISDDLGKDSREIVSLRTLESMFIHDNEATIDTHSTQNAKISFDPSEQCEDVLHRILEETSEPMTESDRQKWNIRPFVMHKKASLPKSPLQKLKEELLEGNHPLLASLKERSNLEGINPPENSQNTFPEVNIDFNDQTTVSKDDLASMNPTNKSNKLPNSPLQEPDDGDNSTRGNTEQIKSKENEMPKEISSKGLEENMLMDHNEKTCDDPNIDHGQQELTGEKSDDEMSNIAAMKEAFLNSQHTLSQDSMATIDSTEIILCMKCNKSGHLLACSSDTCQLRVHETCLGSTTATTLDKNGKFFCPFCAYSHAISNYLEAKKKASLARKDLQAFMTSGVKHRPNKSTQTEDAGQKVKVNINGHNMKRITEDRVPNEHAVDIHLKNENKSHVSSHSRRCREQKPKYTSPTIPLIRRNKLQWTKSEVEILKEGVQRFSSNNNGKGIPWRDILDFGGEVFHKSRTTIDLKDKWRNICKGSPAKKKQKI